MQFVTTHGDLPLGAAVFERADIERAAVRRRAARHRCAQRRRDQGCTPATGDATLRAWRSAGDPPGFDRPQPGGAPTATFPEHRRGDRQANWPQRGPAFCSNSSRSATESVLIRLRRMAAQCANGSFSASNLDHRLSSMGPNRRVEDRLQSAMSRRSTSALNLPVGRPSPHATATCVTFPRKLHYRLAAVPAGASPCSSVWVCLPSLAFDVAEAPLCTVDSMKLEPNFASRLPAVTAFGSGDFLWKQRWPEA